jgi:Cdc6-like AAA superfamily ATPase
VERGHRQAGKKSMPGVKTEKGEQMNSKKGDYDLSDTIRETEEPSFEIPNPYRPFEVASAKWPHHEGIINEIKDVFHTRPEYRAVTLRGNPCSGKTTLLKRIEGDPSLLGKNYIPIYLDSSEYIDLEFNDLLYSISRDIIDKLNKLGYNIPMPDDVKKRKKTENTVANLLLSFDIPLNLHNAILILIFDEFDKFLGNKNAEIIEQYIRMFRYIERSWSNYGIILACDRNPHNITGSLVLKQFLEEIAPIETREIFEEEYIRKQITEPVKNHLEFENEAVDGIIWYCGKNLFFQQLVCYHLVNYLNKKTREQIVAGDIENLSEYTVNRRCTREDVEQVVLQVLNEPSPEFANIWHKKLSISDKIIASALADKSIMEIKNQYYFLRDSSLMENIFGNDLYNQMAALQDFGYIKNMRQGYFLHSPFAVPLYGEWIRNEHPFLKTVIENIGAVAETIDLAILVEKIKAVQQEQLGSFNKDIILEIAEKWCTLTDRIIKQRNIADEHQTLSFIETLSRNLNLSVKEKPRPGENYFILDIKNLNIGTLSDALCFIQDKPELTTNDLFNIESRAADAAKQAQTRLTLLFHFRKDDMIEELGKKDYLNLIAIDDSELKKMIMSERPADAFKKITLSKISLSQISPYQTAGPATAANFYGRSKEIKRIFNASGKSFAIVGARKIGKTSLLLKIKEKNPPDTAYVFIDLQSVFPVSKIPGDITKNKGLLKIGPGKAPYRAFYKTFISEIEKVFKIKFPSTLPPFSDALSRLPNVIQKLSLDGKTLVFILDEIDDLIEFDRKHGFRLLSIFRSLAQRNYCQFIFAGFHSLYHRKRELKNPLYNFCEEIRLKPLDKEAALDLITKPTQRIGIQYQNKKDMDIILEYTGSHPNLLQFFCQKLIEQIDKHDNVEARRTIFFDDISSVVNTIYEDYIMDEVYMFTSGDLGKTGKLILILMAEEYFKSKGNAKIFSIDDINQLLKTNGIDISKNQLTPVIRDLILRFILVDIERDKYSFALSIFPGILKKRIDEDYKKGIIQEIKSHAA